MSRIRTLSLTAAVVLAIAIVACANDVEMGEVVGGPDAAPSLTPPADASVRDATLMLACIGTQCPAPWATCVDDEGPSYKCGVDLTRSAKHCGACGNACPTFAPLHMRSRCVQAACELECFSEFNPIDPADWRNCNAKVDDGCESNVFSDPNNCGVCGNACAPGKSCIEGKCGCPTGLTECNGQCVDTKNDDNHCGACNNGCAEDDGTCKPAPPNTKYGCRNGMCRNLKCKDRGADCNGDLGQSLCNGDGCEVADIARDPKNCGACGIVCKAGEECVDEGNGPECAVPCARVGKTACIDGCKDLLTDVNACGSCNGPCASARPHQVAACTKGVCTYDCAPGWGDCNGDSSDGCETDLGVHPSHCGACGNACDLTAGQPCIEGQCLMTTCDAGVTR